MRSNSHISRFLARPIGLAAGCLLCAQASAIPIDVSTNNAGWTASYSTFSGPAYHYSCGTVDCISISSNGRSGGTFVGGGTYTDFTGTWTATLDFFLPADALNVAYNYASVGVDDRATLALNGVDLGTFYIFGPQILGTITNAASFVLGGLNTLTLSAVNNPFDPNNGAPRPLNPDNYDGTAIVLDGVVTYDQPTAVPEPGSLALFGAALAGLALTRRRISQTKL
jgi:hypothetical protein